MSNNLTYKYLKDHLDEASLRNLFHMCWTFSVNSPDYDKSVWQELAKRLRDNGIELQ